MNDAICELEMNELFTNQSIRIVLVMINSGSSLLLLPLLALGLAGPGVGRVADGALTAAGGVRTGGTQTGGGGSWTLPELLIVGVKSLLPPPQGDPLVLRVVHQSVSQVLHTHIFAAERKL